jgi:uracil-DNA glycosylase
LHVSRFFMPMTIEHFIDQLAKTAVSPDTTNQYALDSTNQKYNQFRRNNLRAYLQAIAKHQPACMLVGEAPGYRGARLTGIPFASPAVLNHLPKRLGMAPLITENEWPHIQKEASATIMWQTLDQITAVPLIWNVYPFHPHQPGKLQSNRRPTQKELALGRSFLQELRRFFAIPIIIAIGNTADKALTRWEFPHQKVRHPSHGGKKAFQQGIAILLEHFNNKENVRDVKKRTHSGD